MKDSPKSPPRLLEPDRAQTRLVTVDLDRLVSPTDGVRAVWAFVDRCDLSQFRARIRAVDGRPGRPAIDPRILLALWIQATLDGVGAAREIARLCETDLRYQWICGGVIPNYHTLSDFRMNGDALDDLLTQTIAVLVDAGLVTIERVAQDGMKVRASAGAGSFRSAKRLKTLRTIAREQVRFLKREVNAEPGAGTRRRQASERNAAEQRARRIERALRQLGEVKKRKTVDNGKKKTKPRASTSDPEARVMKMPDGGFRPALNVHMVTDTKSKCVVAVEINNHGTDHGMMKKLLNQIRRRGLKKPTEWLTDGGCVTREGVLQLDTAGVAVFAPLRKPRTKGVRATDVRKSDPPGIAAWRRRMKTKLAKIIYRQRGATAELVHAQMRAHGLRQFVVRGLKRARAVVLLHILAHNLTRELALTA
jgi:transposase